MVSPELLRRQTFFASINQDRLISIAMIAEEVTVDQGVQIFEECQPADKLCVLIEGSVDLFYKSEEKYHPKARKELPAGEINPGEVFSISALIEPYVLNATGRTSLPSRIIQIDAKALRALIEKDSDLGCILMHQITKALLERLIYTRIQLAAAWAEAQ